VRARSLVQLLLSTARAAQAEAAACIQCMRGWGNCHGNCAWSACRHAHADRPCTPLSPPRARSLRAVMGTAFPMPLHDNTKSARSSPSHSGRLSTSSGSGGGSSGSRSRRASMSHAARISSCRIQGASTSKAVHAPAPAPEHAPVRAGAPQVCWHCAVGTLRLLRCSAPLRGGFCSMPEPTVIPRLHAACCVLRPRAKTKISKQKQ
jgi:hypothetical protein